VEKVRLNEKFLKGTKTMKIIVTEDYQALNIEAAKIIATAVALKPNAAVVVATGNTPVGTYGELASLRAEGKFDPSALQIFQLDEYLGLKAGDERTLWGWMERVFLTPLALSAEKVVRLNCDTQDAAATCAAYDKAVEAAGGFDLAILGLGPNGHLAFNEPPADADTPTRQVTLTEESLASNSVYWGGRDKVPPQAMTAGLAKLLGAKCILLLVSGKSKRDILARVISGPVINLVPASFLQTHPNVIVVADKAASE
jgi:glucosamine-6-phosphate deaminase